MTTVTLGYWKIRGLAQYLRHLLSYTETEFQEIQYDNQDRWFKEDKLNLGLDFPNIPYLIDGDFKLTESSAIAKYIIKRSGKTDLLGKNTRDQGKVDALISVINDALKDIRGLFWNKDHETLKIELLEKARPKFNYIKDFVGDRQFALGYLTVDGNFVAWPENDDISDLHVSRGYLGFLAVAENNSFGRSQIEECLNRG